MSLGGVKLDEKFNDEDFILISKLTANMEKWKIKAKVTRRNGVKKFKTSKGSDGEVFSIDIVDSSGEEIRCSFFNCAATKYSELIDLNKVYAFGNGIVRTNNKTL